MQSSHPRPRASRLITSILVGASLLVATLGFAGSSANAQPAKQTVKPTIVLVHGAFADASSWNGVTAQLLDAGYPVIAPAVPLRGLSADSAYLASILATIDGPIVLVGHSYGGAVVTDAATGNANVVALVYVAAFVPDSGESLADIAAQYPDSDLGPALRPRPYPMADGTTGIDLYIDPTAFRDVFARDVSRATAATMAVAQRPLSLTAFTEPSGEPAWKSIPSWYLVAGNDRAIDPVGERAMAARAGSSVAEVRASHAVLVSDPSAVTRLITTAVRATR